MEKKIVYYILFFLFVITILFLYKKSTEEKFNLDKNVGTEQVSCSEDGTESEVGIVTSGSEILDVNTELATNPYIENKVIEKEDFVCVVDYIPDIEIDLKYATYDNFTSTVIYDFSDAYLRYGTVEKLKKVQNAVSEAGYSLKIWDSFRPVEAQFKLWEICPNSTYVANPNKGYSSHSRGNTVDLTLVYKDGSEVEMPTGFDDFSAMADRDYNDCSSMAAEHALYLENIMIEYGFTPYQGEWWHFSDTDTYDVEKEFCP